MSVMGFQNKSLNGGGCHWGELYPVLFWMSGICFNFAKPLSSCGISEIQNVIVIFNGECLTVLQMVTATLGSII